MPIATETPNKDLARPLPEPQDGARVYEFSVVLPAVLPDKELKESIRSIEGIFEEKGAKLITKHEWGKRGIAYKIKGCAEGRYFMYLYEIKPGDIKDISSSIRLEKNVLRHLLLSTLPSYEIIDWGAHFNEWLKSREKEAEIKEEKKQEELKKIIVRKATKKTPADTAEKDEAKDGKEEGDLGKKIEELISDEDLNL